MPDVERARQILGKTIRFIWTEGPTKGSTHEHMFHEDGTVEWYDPAQRSGSPGHRKEAAERPPYAALTIAEDVYAVSYLAASGYTLTVVLNFGDKRIAGVASSSKEWYIVRGTFEVEK
jgi:hypothetical protein